jgi:hypothetical protein
VQAGTSLLKRLVLGRPFAVTDWGETLLSRRLGLPIFASAVVLISRAHKPTLRALAFALASHPDTLTAATVNVDTADTRQVQGQWAAEHDLPVALTVVDSPYREITRPIVENVNALRRERPCDIVAVDIPEYVVGRWWENCCTTSRHNGPRRACCSSRALWSSTCPGSFSPVPHANWTTSSPTRSVG